jgi:2-methylcitrate dehydratase PrpD
VDTKQLHNAEAARSGVMAAMLAAEGLTGPTAILEGAQGFFAATSPNANADLVVSESDAPWLVFDCSFKPWPACRHTHAAIDAVRLLELSVAEKSNLKELKVETYRDAIVFCDRPNPVTELDAKFSLQHCAAVVLEYATPELAHFKIESLKHSALKKWRDLVTVLEDQSLQNAYPQQFASRAIATFTDGTTKTALVKHAWGDPDNAMSTDDIIAKAKTLFAAADFSEEKANQIIKAALQLLDGGTLSAISAALRR